MDRTNHYGFSLIELLIVVVVIGVVAAIAVPALRKATIAADNGNTFATMRTISSTQASIYSQQERFGRLDEINRLTGNVFGDVVGNQASRYKFNYVMVPANPSDAELRQQYTVTATRNVAGEGVIYQYEVTQSGEVRQILP